MSSDEEEFTKYGQDRVADFYHGKSIFLTGASGFVGSILLECLLRCCPGIETIYILIRAKKGVDVAKRKLKILEKKIFGTLKQSNPLSLDKIRVVKGDITLPGFGLSDSDHDTLVQEVSIVFHCAASIALIKPLEEIVRLNSQSVNSMIDLCKEMKKLEVLVYTSTAYSNANRSKITETIYRLPFPAQQFIDALNAGKEELQALVDECYPRWPNTYTFSKCLSENLLADNASDIPIAIVRPSIVGCVYKSPLPGYVEDMSGFMALSLCVAKGFSKVVWFALQSELNFVSADATANAHIISAWSIGTGRHKAPLVVNAAKSRDVDTFEDYKQELLPLAYNTVFPNSFSRPSQFLIVTENLMWYKIAAFFQHYIHAYVIDYFLEMKGKKPRMVSLYQLYDRTLLSIYDISKRSYSFVCDNFENMNYILHPEDAKTFSTDLKGYGCKIAPELLKIGAPMLDFSSDKRTLEERQVIRNKRFWTMRIIRMTVILVFFLFLYLAFIILERLYQTFSNIIQT